MLARELRLRFIAARTPAGVVRGLTARVGRQPPPVAPWMLGPWFQTGHDDKEPAEGSCIRRLRGGDAPVSVVETHMRYMPCGNDRGSESSERSRTAGLHRSGLAAITYLREAVCSSYEPIFSQGVAGRLFLKRADGTPYTYRAFVGGRVTDIGQIDFGAQGAEAFHARLLGRAVANGYDGWMEDFGEYTPPDSAVVRRDAGPSCTTSTRAATTAPGSAFGAPPPAPDRRASSARAGPGSAPCAQVVWGGDPTTSWGFDGLQLRGAPGAQHGALGDQRLGLRHRRLLRPVGDQLTPELLHRWIQFGAVSGVMRTEADGHRPTGDAAARRSGTPTDRHLAALREAAHPALPLPRREPTADYRRNGMPLMRQLCARLPRRPRGRRPRGRVHVRARTCWRRRY